MEPTFRKSMAWLHTWAGVVIGSLLFAIFWMGSLSVFDREIDRWMMPGTRLSASADSVPIQLDGALTDNALALTQGSTQWFMRLPSGRVPALELRWRTRGGSTERRHLHPSNGQVLEHTEREQAWALAALATLAVLLNWLTTGHHLAHTIGHGLWAVAGMDALLLLAAGLAFIVARHLSRKARRAATEPAVSARLGTGNTTRHA